MTRTRSTGDNGVSPAVEREQIYEHLAKALDADELDEKNYHVREALQLLNIDGD